MSTHVLFPCTTVFQTTLPDHEFLHSSSIFELYC